MFGRLRRIHHETGIAGLLLRPPFRALIWLAERLTVSLRSALGKVPLRWFTPASIKVRLASNATLKNKHHGERCFILGNGPSLAQETISLLAGETLLTCNQGHQFMQMHGLTTRYHFFVDAIFLNPEYAGFLDEMIALHRNQNVTLITSTDIGDALRRRGQECVFHEIHQYPDFRLYHSARKAAA